MQVMPVNLVVNFSPLRMKESGWLTRSLEQNIPYELDFPGKIQNKNVKAAFLNILNDVEVNGADSEKYVTAIMAGV